MRKIKERKFNPKKMLYSAALLASLSLVGCADDNNNVITESTTTEEITTEEVTEAITEEQNDNSRYEEVATLAYNENKDFYEAHGAELDDLVNIIKIINDDTADLTDEQIDYCTELIRKITLPDELNSALVMCKYQEIDDSILYDIPPLSVFVEDEELRNEIAAYEDLRDKIQDELKQNNQVSDSTKQELIAAVINQEEKYYSDNSSESKQIDSIGQNLIHNETKIQLINLTISTTGLTEVSDDDYTVYLAPATEEEINAMSMYEQMQDATPDEEKRIYFELQSRLAITKYENDRCSYLIPEIKSTNDEIAQLLEFKQQLTKLNNKNSICKNNEKTYTYMI